MGVQGTALIKSGKESLWNKMFIMLCCGAGIVQWFLANQHARQQKNASWTTTIEARSHTDVSGYLSSISILMLGPHYGGELPKWKSLCDPYHVPVVVIPQDIYAQLNGDALIQLALDTLGK